MSSSSSRKKTNKKKLSPVILVAIIGFFGTIIAAIFNSSVLVAIINKPISTSISSSHQFSSPPSTISAPAAITEYTSRILAKVDWQSSNIYIFNGNKVEVVTRNERWSAYEDSSGNPVLTDANGRAINSYFSEFGLYAPLGSLIAKIGDGHPILIGKEEEFIADMNGVLYFRILDRNLDDNSGSITIQIGVQR